MQHFLTVCLALVAATVASSASLPRIKTKLRSNGDRVLVDEYGRERAFHGANAVVKGPPYYPSRGAYDPKISLVKEDFEMMRDAGINFIRLGVMWPGVEPVRGEYNRTYLSIMREISEEAASYGIYTLADMHQDVLSEKYCGEGVPMWGAQNEEVLEFPLPLAEPYRNVAGGIPSRQDCAKKGWPSYYGTVAVGSAFERLYTHQDLLESWGLFWKEVAVTYQNASYLLGYELINEPFAGNPYTNPALMVPGVADKERLQPAYDTISKKLREAAPDGLVFFAGVTWDRDGDIITDNLPWGFTHPPGGPEYADRSVLAYHFYSPPQLAKDSLEYFRTRQKDARKLGTAMFLTETFSWHNHSVPLANAESMMVSWGAWEWKDFCKETPATLNSSSQFAVWGACKTGYGGVIPPSSSPEANLASLSRAYARAISGEFVSSSYDDTNNVFTLAFTADTSISHPTEVFLPPLRFPSPNITVASPAPVKYTMPSPSLLLLTVPPSAHGALVTVTVK